MKKIILLTLFATTLSMGMPALGISQEVAAKEDIVIIVNHENPVRSIKKSLLRRYFLKKTTEWKDGVPVVPVDLATGDPVRESFSKWILNKDAEKIEGYWISQGLIGGKSAPPIRNSAISFKKYITEHAGAIGYIARSDLDSTVKTIEVVE